MQTASMIILGLLGVTMAVMMAPGVIAMNRGRMLRNIAGWLAIVLVLALVYQNFRPDRSMVMPPAVSANRQPLPGTVITPAETPTTTTDAPKPASNDPASTEPSVPKITGGVKDEAPDDGYTPPRED